ncbi:MAG TPA: hypothetical protein PKD51_09725 [Saprospiraceae bacterium]|nr:hypothetical protein [Saprospiraceae bacterium]
MSKDQFDDIIKDKLESVSSPLGADTWSAFEKILNADADLHQDVDDKVFESTVKEKLSSNHLAGKDTQWNILKEKLNNIKNRKDTIYLSKAMELAAVFLIIFTLTNINGYIFHNKEKENQNKQVHYASVDNNASLNTATKIDAHSKSNSNGKTNPTARYAASSKRSDNIILKVNTPIKPTLIQNIDVANVLPSELYVLSNNSILDANTDVKNDMTTSTNAIVADVVTEDGQTLYAAETNDQLASNELLNIEPIPLEIEPIYTELASIFPLQISKNKSRQIIALAAFTSADINLINTPFDKVYSLPSYTKEALNNSYGLRLSTKTDKLEIETGLDYSKREYQPSLFKEAFGNTSDVYFETSLDKISFDIASIPLNVKYHFLNKKGWGSYIMVGAAMNFIVNAAYDIPVVLVEGRPSPDRYTPVRPRLEEKEFTEGLFNGAALKDNYFVTAGFGIGIEKKIFHNTSLYVQPSYQRHLFTPGIGPKNDKIHTSSLQFGIKTILN